MARIFFLMGVAGSWKTTVLTHAWLWERHNFIYVPSYTTRPLRAGEINGHKYRHITKEAFEAKIKQGDFLEYALVHQMYLYGTDYTAITAPLTRKQSTIKEIEIYGLLNIQADGRIQGQYTTIFLDIPDDLMLERITQRQTISDEELKNRLISADFERLQAKNHCDHIIDATQPLDTVCEIVTKICTQSQE